MYSKGLSAWISVSLRPRDGCSRESSHDSWSIQEMVVDLVGMEVMFKLILLIDNWNWPCQTFNSTHGKIIGDRAAGKIEQAPESFEQM